MINLNAQELNIVKSILSEKCPNTPAWVFGSRVKGTNKPFSDIDLALITTTPLTIRELTELELAFSDSDLPFKVDLVDWASCSETFKQIILQKYEILTP